MCIDMASILIAVVMCFNAGFAAPLHQGPHTLNLELALFDASLHLGDIRAYVAEWDKSHVRAAVVGDLFAGDGHLYEAAMDRGYHSWKYDMIYDPIVQNILTKRPKLNKEFQGSTPPRDLARRFQMTWKAFEGWGKFNISQPYFLMPGLYLATL